MEPMRYNFLILHGTGGSRPARITTINHLKFLERYAPGGHNFLYHRWDEPITGTLRKTDIHVFVLTSSALNARRRRPRERYYRSRDAWSFVADLDAVKLAFPQDDYDHTNDLDVLFNGWGVDIVYSIVPEHMEMLYPLSRGSADLKGVLTGYVDDDSIESTARFNKHFGDRGVDIFQRVRMHLPSGGSHSQIKGRMTNRFLELGERRGLRMDISTRPEDVLYGDRWLENLGNSRFALGCEGGVSLWDPDGTYRDLVLEYVKEHQDASYEEVEAACFPGEDGRYIFSAISPRLFESAIMGCCQILVEGEYLGLLRPWEHYIPVRRDFSNVEDALEATADWDAAKRRVAACYETLVENPSLRYSTLASDVINDVERLSSGRGFQETDTDRFREIVAEHRAELRSLTTWNACRPAADFGGRFRSRS